jgi:hypothetical protein
LRSTTPAAASSSSSTSTSVWCAAVLGRQAQQSLGAVQQEQPQMQRARLHCWLQSPGALYQVKAYEQLEMQRILEQSRRTRAQTDELWASFISSRRQASFFSELVSNSSSWASSISSTISNFFSSSSRNCDGSAAEATAEVAATQGVSEPQLIPQREFCAPQGDLPALLETDEIQYFNGERLQQQHEEAARQSQLEQQRRNMVLILKWRAEEEEAKRQAAEQLRHQAEVERTSQRALHGFFKKYLKGGSKKMRKLVKSASSRT